MHPMGTPEAEVNHAWTLQQQGKLQAAGHVCERLTQVHPGFAPGWARWGHIELECGNFEQALAHTQKATETNPHCSFSLLCHGIVLRAVGQVTQATRQLATALEISPRNAVAWSHYGLCLSDQFQHELALAALQSAIDLDPGSAFHWSNRLMSLQYDPGLNSARLTDAARAFSAHLGERPNVLERKHTGNIHVAYLSPDLYNHPVGRLFLPVLSAHDQDRFQVTVLADGVRSDPLTEQIATASGRFVQTAKLDDRALAALLAELGVDVLVDLAGHTASNRLPAFARRMSPVQITWLGYFSTTGLKNMDAVVLGEAHCDAATQAFFTEPVKTVPGTHFVYQPPPYLPPINTTASGQVRFASFNNSAKLNTEVFACWSEILRQVPGSTLLLKWKTLADPQFAQHLRARFANLGLAPERLILQPQSDHATLLAAYNNVDIALDTFPFSGGITSFEALSMGVPVVTQRLLRPSSRQTAALLGQLGLHDLVTGNAREYCQVAVALAADAEQRTHLRETLRPRILKHGREHARVVAAGLESIYTGLLEATGT